MIAHNLEISQVMELIHQAVIKRFQAGMTMASKNK